MFPLRPIAAKPAKRAKSLRTAAGPKLAANVVRLPVEGLAPGHSGATSGLEASAV